MHVRGPHDAPERKCPLRLLQESRVIDDVQVPAVRQHAPVWLKPLMHEHKSKQVKNAFNNIVKKSLASCF
jgi:hypothetical protein